MRLLALGTLAKEEVGAALRQRGAIFMWRTVAALCILCIAAIGLVSLHRFVTDRYGPYWADATLAGLFALVAIASVIVASVLERRARQSQRLRATVMAAASVASQALPDKNSALQALVIAALAGGFWFGRKR